MDLNQLLPAEPLIPHRRRMRLIEWVKRMTRNGLEAGTTVSEEWPLNRDGMVNSLMCIELVAQAIAALSTWRRGEGAGPRLGLLVGIKEAEFSKSSVPVGTRLNIQINELSHVGDYAVFEGIVRSDLDLFCKIIIQVMEPEEEVLSNLKTKQKI
jgi:predicted hotdog family 3-hydroxylacyl-ACP dehydratase